MSLRAERGSDTTQVAALLDRMLDGCAVYEPVRDQHGRIVDFERTHLNPAGIRRTASMGIDVRITSLREAVPGVEQGLLQRYADVVETQRAWSGEDVTYRDGTLSGVYDIQAWPVGDGLAVTWREVTDRERVLEALRSSEQQLQATNLRLEESSQSLRDLLGLVGHDLKNPLTVALGFLSMTGLELDDLEQVGTDVTGARDMLTRATDAALRVQGLLVGVLEMSRIDYGTLRSQGEPVDVDATVRQAVGELSVDSEVGVVGLAGLRAVADSSHLRQVLGNLLTNADKYGAAPVTITGATDGATTRIVVGDGGDGVPEDFLPRLFDRFSRADGSTQPGTGLGLHLARQLCRAMGGDLTYEPPAPGRGPAFVVSLAAG